ncbi:MAG: 3-hydroxyisobutyrate dehydrogenase [Gammaproteobacteria bacterium RIFCSPHIGHO2_12_FULL_37_34]|nr:MAG: 3-hydroxyisobutyrate dehydrogenase [Gammaproteobacteria bacterium RIFCSPHIGHO2_12_FULL_37_34]
MITVGFIGLGHMGHPMANNLLKAGYTLQVYDVLPQLTQALCDRGATLAPSIVAIAKEADVIITSVQTSEQVHDICMGEDGLFTHAQPDLLYIDCSSIDIKMSVLLHDQAKKFGIAMLDAPVSGGVAGATAAILTFMVGGSDIDFERGRPILETMGKKIVHAGPGGHGQAAKICNNLLLGISMIGVGEAFTLAEKLGLDQKKFFEISSNSSGQCWSMTNYCPVPDIVENVPANHHYQPGFMAKMMLKDLRLANHAAETVDAVIPLGTVAMELYELYVNQGFGEIDFSGIINLIAGKD